MTYKQMQWAGGHDWFRSASLINGKFNVTVKNDMGGEDLIFTDFDELYIWAGY
jgi:hypothetical protein